MRPLAAHQRFLHAQPVFRGLIKTSGSVAASDTACANIVESAAASWASQPWSGLIIARNALKCSQVHAHLVDKLRHRHLLRSGHLVEIPAIGARIVDRLNRPYAHQLHGLFIGNLCWQACRAAAARYACSTSACVRRRLSANRPAAADRTPPPARDLPMMASRNGCGFSRIRLRMCPLRQIEAESRADQRLARPRVGIGCKHPSFMPAVAQNIHELIQVELHIRITKALDHRDGRTWQHLGSSHRDRRWSIQSCRCRRIDRPACSAAPMPEWQGPARRS